MTKRTIALSLLFLSLPLLVAAKESKKADLPVVPTLDLAQYSGKWYEIGRLPNKFEKDCAGDVTATYSLNDDGTVKVINECRKFNGKNKKSTGKARLADKNGANSKLEVRFAPSWLSWLPAVWGDYWVLELAPDYSYSLVGTPDRKYLWILARKPTLSAGTYQSLLAKAAANGFAINEFVKTEQR